MTLKKASGVNISCYVSNFITDFLIMQGKDSEYTHRYSVTDSDIIILMNRISHAFNLQGLR